MRIWHNFKTLAAHIPYLQKRICWQTCRKCGINWNDSQSIHVHMIIEKNNKTYYICDNCANKSITNN